MYPLTAALMYPEMLNLHYIKDILSDLQTVAVADTVHNNDEARSCVSLVMITPDNNTPAAGARGERSEENWRQMVLELASFLQYYTAPVNSGRRPLEKVQYPILQLMLLSNCYITSWKIVKPWSKSPIPCPNRPQILTLR